MPWDWMKGDMARRIDEVFPEAGGLERLREVRVGFVRTLGDVRVRAGSTYFHPREAEHIKKALKLLGDDEEAKATLMSTVAFAQMKNDVAHF